MDRLGPYLLGPNDTAENGIYTGDARELSKAIPDESVDLIFTDPVYDRIDDYRWLAETAARVLKPDSALLIWSNGKWHKKHADWMEHLGFIYRYDFIVAMIRAMAPMNGKIISKAYRLIWMDKSGKSKLFDYLADGYPSRTDRKLGNHKWAKNPRFTRYALEAFTLPDDIVFDPFCGGGTVPGVCAYSRLCYLAFEIDPDTAELARQRVRNTQPPLFVPQAEQLELIA